MLESLRKMWKIDDLRKKLIYTFLMLLLYRLVGVIPAPGVDVAKVMTSAASGLPLLELVNMMTGNAFSQMTIMAMGITPYINASIIMQLLTIAIPALERTLCMLTTCRMSMHIYEFTFEIGCMNL